MNPLWRIGSIALALLLIASLAFNVRYKLEVSSLTADLATANGKVTELTASVKIQNDAVDALGAKKDAADKTATMALQLAKVNNKRYEDALAKTSKATATTCEEAMPVLDANVFGDWSIK